MLCKNIFLFYLNLKFEIEVINLYFLSEVKVKNRYSKSRYFSERSLLTQHFLLYIFIYSLNINVERKNFYYLYEKIKTFDTSLLK